jgi:uncharacterized protein YaeQ
MKILYRKKIICEVTNHLEMEEFIKNKKFYKFFLKFPNDKILKIQHQIDSTEILSYKGIKPWIKSILNYPETIYNKKFLHCMGWEDSEIEKLISNKQKNNSKILSENKKNNPDKYNKVCPKKIEYWVEKGFSVEEGKKKISESQKTFSKEICIEKYGEENGLKIFKKRQEKWVKSLSNLEMYDKIQLKKNSYNYGFKLINELVNRSSFLKVTKQLILDNLNLITIEEFVNKIIELVDIKSSSDILPFYNSKLIQNHYNISGKEIKNLFYNNTPLHLHKLIYGTPIYHKGNRFKSVKEYRLALFFEEKKIRYEYEKQYPNCQYKSDFYLPNENLYIEYFGMLENKNYGNLNEIQTQYKNKMEIKISYCNKNNLSLVYNTNFKKLIETLNNIL